MAIAATILVVALVRGPSPEVTPTPTDFTITVTEVRKECFGVAGCNVTYAIAPTYHGAAPLPHRSITVVYDVSGGTSLQTDRFTITDGIATFYKEGVITTASTGAVLSAAVTKVL